MNWSDSCERYELWNKFGIMLYRICDYCDHNYINDIDVWICDSCWDSNRHLPISDLRRWS